MMSGRSQKVKELSLLLKLDIKAQLETKHLLFTSSDCSSGVEAQLQKYENVRTDCNGLQVPRRYRNTRSTESLVKNKNN